MWKKLVQILLLSLIGASAQAESIVAALGSNNARFFYSTEMWGQQAGPVELETGFYFDEDNNYLLNLGMLLRNDTMDSPFIFSLGGRTYMSILKDEVTNQEYNIFALALGAELLYVPDNLGGVGIGISYFYAPDILSGADSQGVSELGFMIDYQLTPQSNIFVGYRDIEVDIKELNQQVEFTSGAYIGIGIRY